MSIFTVHAPPPDEAASDPERFEFVRDGFHFWAFVFGPVWLLCKRLWLSLVIYIAIAAVLQTGLWLMQMPPITHTLVSLMMHLLVGLEAATLRRWTLNRRGWTQIGLVSGDSYEAAERRFFDSWVARTAKPEPAPQPAMPPSARVPPASSDIIGLFPEPQSRQ